MDLYSLDVVRNDERPPHGIGAWIIGKDRKEPLDYAKPSVGLRNAEAIAAACRRRTGTHVPEFLGILRGCNSLVTHLPKSLNSVTHVRMVRVRRFQTSQEYARVNED